MEKENYKQLLNIQLKSRHKHLKSVIKLFDEWAIGSLCPEQYNQLQEIYKTLKRNYIKNINQENQ